jgi:hypothetical protein
MTGFGWLLIALGSAVQATEFQLNTDTPDSLCPELSMTRNAVRQRLGQLETEASGRWHGMYSSVHDPTGRRGDYVRLVISDVEGREQLTRELPMKGESCETLVQAIALVVDGFFRELAQSEARDERDEVAANDAPKPQPAMELPVASPHLTLPESPAQRPIRQPRMAFALGAGYESVPSKSTVTAGLSIGILAHWNWQLQIGIPFSKHRDDVPPGVATAYVIPARLSLSYVLEPIRRMEWFIGPEGFFSLEHGATQKIPAGRNGWRVSPGIGVQTAVVGWVAQSIALYMSLAADVVLLESRQFLVYEEPVFEFARTRLSATAGLRAVIWR